MATNRILVAFELGAGFVIGVHVGVSVWMFLVGLAGGVTEETDSEWVMEENG